MGTCHFDHLLNIKELLLTDSDTAAYTTIPLIYQLFHLELEHLDHVLLIGYCRCEPLNLILTVRNLLVDFDNSLRFLGT